MIRTALLAITLGLLFSKSALSCDNNEGEYLEFSIDSSEYVTKPDKSKPVNKSAVTNRFKYPNLYCSISSGSKCDKDSVWFSGEDFAKYLVGYKPVHCHQVVSTFKMRYGIQSRSTSFKVYYIDKKF